MPRLAGPPTGNEAKGDVGQWSVHSASPYYDRV